MKSVLEQNKVNAITFYRMSYEGNPRSAVEQFVEANIYNIIHLSEMEKNPL